MTAMTDERARDPLAAVVAAREELTDARARARKIFQQYERRLHAQYGLRIAEAYQQLGRGAQAAIQQELGAKSREDVARYERTFRAWTQEHPNDDLTREPDWNALLGESGLLQRAS
jgi:vacuolar-type H+-ATPase subunit H